MIISKLILNNIGVYAGRNVFNLKADKPIILVGGLNGRGKTTILEAILFALYGKRACGFLDYNIKFEDYLRQITNKTDGTNQGNITIEFDTRSGDEESSYEVCHEWKIKGKRVEFNTAVNKAGSFDAFLSDNWGMFIENILPGAIAPFFFFDGEKIAGLAGADSDEQFISSIESLLGLDVIEQSIEDLDVLVRKKRKDIKNILFQDELEEVDDQLEQKTAEYVKLKKDYEKIKSKYKMADNSLQKAEEKFTISGGNLKQEREELLRKKELICNRMQENDLRLLDISAGDLPIILVLPLIKEALSSVNEEKTAQNAKIVIEQLPKIYDAYFSQGGSAFEFDDFYNYIKENSVDHELTYNLTDDGQWRLNILHKDLETIKNETLKVIKEQDALRKKLEVLEDHLLLSINEDYVKKVYEELKESARTKADLEARSNTISTNIEEIEIEIENLKTKRQKVLDNAVSEMEQTDKAKRTIDYIFKVKGLLEKYKYEVQNEKIKTLEKTITECLQKITAKKGLIKDVTINPKTLTFTYYNGKDKVVNKSALSAGEKQLLVIGMLWALGICSEKELPVIIDTPLARLDSLHRKGLIDNYLPKASRQVIVLSTDQEITSEDYNRLKPYVGKEYTLIYDDNTMSTTISEGYFGGSRQ